MPIKPPPRTYTCPKCGWSKSVAPKSDAFGPGDFFESCPKCGNERLETHAARFVKGFLSVFSPKIEKHF
ncbi:MAG: hypothetical protein LBS49_13630 [Candidatus Accumulibacter sp.]|jgi:ssDNA-binding Zn-finger/Zn-ribbon topoisomerase 1|nr:hypothetical protein [Accumulibacter sp.]